MTIQELHFSSDSGDVGLSYSRGEFGIASQPFLTQTIIEYIIRVLFPKLSLLC
jgi:hypothetical protein